MNAVQFLIDNNILSTKILDSKQEIKFDGLVNRFDDRLDTNFDRFFGNIPNEMLVCDIPNINDCSRVEMAKAYYISKGNNYLLNYNDEYSVNELKICKEYYSLLKSQGQHGLDIFDSRCGYISDKIESNSDKCSVYCDFKGYEPSWVKRLPIEIELGFSDSKKNTISDIESKCAVISKSSEHDDWFWCFDFTNTLNSQ